MLKNFAIFNCHDSGVIDDDVFQHFDEEEKNGSKISKHADFLKLPFTVYVFSHLLYCYNITKLMAWRF